MSGDSGPAERPSAGVAVLLGLRFLVELALWASFVVAVVRLVPGPLGWVLGVAAMVAVTVVWGLFLSPRRRIRLSLVARIALELALFGLAAALLAASGLPAYAVGLLAAELLVLGLLRGPDRHAL